MNQNSPFKSPHEFDRKLIEIAHHMTRTGIRMDLEKLNELRTEKEEERVRLQEELNHLVGYDLNVMSSPQMKKVLYKDLGLPKRKKQKKVTADEAALRATMTACKGRIDELKTEEAKMRWGFGLAICQYALKIRKVRKQISSYLDINIDEDRRVRTSIAVGGTETFRFSHSKTPWDTGLNLATVPRSLRSAYIASEGKYLAEFDLNRGESWVYAFASEDPELMRIHSEGGDFHSETAAIISSTFADEPLSVEQIIKLYEEDDDMGYYLRYVGKRVNHATTYLMKAFTGAEAINKESDETGIIVTPAQMKEAQGAWLQKYFGVPMWWDWIARELARTRRLITPYGRIRTFHSIRPEDIDKQTKPFRDAVAHIPQNTSVEYMNHGMVRLYDFMKKEGYPWGMNLLHQNHDSVLVEFDKEHVDEAIPQIAEILEGSLVIQGISGREHEITIPIEGGYGDNWREQKPYKLNATAA